MRHFGLSAFIGKRLLLMEQQKTEPVPARHRLTEW
jgi:hypothetical protein